jgi:hypothetical protein
MTISQYIEYILHHSSRNPYYIPGTGDPTVTNTCLWILDHQYRLPEFIVMGLRDGQPVIFTGHEEAYPYRETFLLTKAAMFVRL